MLNETLKALRKQKGYSQEEVAGRLNVVRQTVSKWETGLSVPDADMLVRLSELFEVSVPVLLGAAPEPEKDASGQPETPPLSMSEIAEQLSRINEQMVVKNRRSRRIAKTVGIIVLILIGLRILLTIITVSAFTAFTFSESTTVQTQSITEALGELYDALPLP